MNQNELNKVLKDHVRWLNDDGGKRADLRGSNLRGNNLSGSNLRVSNLRGSDLSNSDLRNSDLSGSNLSDSDLRGSDLRGSNLRGSNLRGSNLKGANIDYSCWPLWCGSLDAKIDTRIAVQLLYHLMRPCLVSPDVDEDFKRALFTPKLIEWANQFHRVEECGKIEYLKRKDP